MAHNLRAYKRLRGKETGLKMRERGRGKKLGFRRPIPTLPVEPVEKPKRLK